jgi:hypothetical protein
MKIRFSQPVIAGRELDYVRQALEQGRLSSHGEFTRRCEAWLAARLNAPRAHLTNSATAGLELSALLAELGSGDEVIMPAFTFVSCANAVTLRGATPVFVDIRPDTLNLDPNAVAQAITARTRAIVAVHYAGVPCDMAPIMALAAQHGLIVIEDAAQALLSPIAASSPARSGISASSASMTPRTSFPGRAEPSSSTIRASPRGPRLSAIRALIAAHSSAARGPAIPGPISGPRSLRARSPPPSCSRSSNARKTSHAAEEPYGRVIIPLSRRLMPLESRAAPSFRMTWSTTGIFTICCCATRQNATDSLPRWNRAASRRRSTSFRSTTRRAVAASRARTATCRQHIRRQGDWSGCHYGSGWKKSRIK